MSVRTAAVPFGRPGPAYRRAIRTAGRAEVRGILTCAAGLGLLLAVHAAFGWAMSQSKNAATLHAFAAAAAALGLALSVPRPRAVLIVCCYLLGCEVLWRMCGAAVFWEFGKYLTAAVLLVAMARRDDVRPSAAPLFYFAVLLPPAVQTLALLDWTSARQQLSFNLSGPLTLAMAVVYFSNVRLEMNSLRAAVVAVMAPVSAIVTVIYLRMPAAGEMEFTSDSNFAASGGFGPNQVSAILALGGLFCLVALVVCRLSRLEQIMAFAAGLIALIQSALTFSRGGLYIAAASAAAGLLFLLCERAARRKVLFTAAVLLLAGATVVPYLNDWTANRLTARFLDVDLTHRQELVRDDIAVWIANPIFGVGPGRAGEQRGAELGGAAAHTEFTRVLAEHGLWGFCSIAILGWMSWRRFSAASGPREMALVAALLTWPLLFMAINSMRLAAPSLLFGLAFARWSSGRDTANQSPQPDLSPRVLPSAARRSGSCSLRPEWQRVHSVE